MESTDLRIGNYIYFTDPESGTPIVQAVRGLNTPTMNYFTPIPLDEIWLEEIGFLIVNKLNFEGFWNNGDNYFLELDVDSEYFDLFKYDGDVDLVFLTSIKYVHQLQNLYYALTGQELTLTLR